jgi:hypothetical protein
LTGEAPEGLSSLNKEESEALLRRGYLIDDFSESEEQQGRKALEITAAKLKRGCDLVFRFAPVRSSAGQPPVGAQQVDQVFAVLEKAKIPRQCVAVILDVAAGEIDPTVVERILLNSSGRDYSVVPIFNIDGMRALRRWISSQNFRVARLDANKSDMPADMEELAALIVDYYEHQVHVGVMCNVDGWSDAQLKVVSELREIIRRKYPFFMLWLTSESQDGVEEPGFVSAGGVQMPYISKNNEAVLNGLFRSITSPKTVNYTPFFQPEPAKLTMDVATNEAVYERPGRKGVVKGLAEVERAIVGDFTEDEMLLDPEKAAQCLSCKYALVCGRNWLEEHGYSSAGECAAAYERRIQNILPSLFYNIRGNLRRTDAGGKAA